VMICGKCEGACEPESLTNKQELTSIPGANTGTAGPYIVSNNARFVLRMQNDGNLVLYKVDHYHWKWQTHTSRYRNYGPFRFVVQEDGNMVLYDKDNTVRWASNTVQEPKEVEVEDDKKDKKKGDGKTKSKDEKKEKKTKKVPWKVELKLQDDGNLVLYREDGKVLWASNTAGRKDASAEDSSLTVQGADGVLLKRAVSDDEEGSKEDEEEKWAADKQQDDKDAASEPGEKPVDDHEDQEADEEEGRDDDEKMAESAGDDDGAAHEDGAAQRSQLYGSFKETHGNLPFVEHLGEEGLKRKEGERGRTLKRRIDKAAAGSVSPVQEVIDSLV